MVVDICYIKKKFVGRSCAWEIYEVPMGVPLKCGRILERSRVVFPNLWFLRLGVQKVHF